MIEAVNVPPVISWVTESTDVANAGVAIVAPMARAAIAVMNCWFDLETKHRTGSPPNSRRAGHDLYLFPMKSARSPGQNEFAAGPEREYSCCGFLLTRVPHPDGSSLHSFG